MSGAAGIFPSTVFGEGPLGPGIDAPAPLARESPFVGAISDVVENPSVRAADDTGASATSAGCVCTVAIARSRDCSRRGLRWLGLRGGGQYRGIRDSGWR